MIENSIRPLALGRKNFLFAGNHDVAENIAMFYSFFGTCKKSDVDPRNGLPMSSIISTTQNSLISRTAPAIY